MGHIRVGELPRTGYWKQVINKLGLTDDPAAIAAITAKAAHEGLDLAKHDSGVAHVIYLFIKTILSSKSKRFIQKLKYLGMELSTTGSLLDVIGEFDKAVDAQLLKSRQRSDLAEMARLTAVDTLTEICQQQTKSLFGNDIQQTQIYFRKYTSKKLFGIAGRRFFGKFLYRFLDYHLSRELANHVGLERTHATIHECREFKYAMERHCIETTLIIKDFSGAWPLVTEFRGGITAETVRTKFVPIAFQKIQSELQKR
ncbi:MAG: hypothetical protein JXA82_13280 [Sedimentisphaerales bacterium]|nr:hypothetical protein [Sedimentisphaerales bacterium]